MPGLLLLLLLLLLLVSALFFLSFFLDFLKEIGKLASTAKVNLPLATALAGM